MRKLTISPPVASYTPAEWLTYVNTLRAQRKGVPGSRSVPDVLISVSKSRTIVKFRRPLKQLTLAEVALLAVEYELNEINFMAYLTKRKIRVVNEQGEHVNAVKPRQRKAKKAHAGSKKRRRKNSGDDQLVQPGPDSDVPA